MVKISFKTIPLLSIGKAKFRTGTSFHQVDFKPKGKPLIKIGNMKGQTIDFSQVDYVTPKGKNFAEENEILIAMRSGTTGKLAIVDNKSAGSHFVGSIGNFGPIDDQLIWAPYLKYIQAQLYSHFVEGTKGSATPMVSIEMLRKINIRIPDSIDGQKAMYAFLENAHDKIGNLESQIITQSTYLTQLRQAILQEAIEGKLTAEWRKKNLPSSPKASTRKNPSGLPQASHLPLAGEEKDGSEGSPPAKGEYGEAGRGFFSPRDEKDLPAEYYDAAVLLAKIKAEKAALVAAGKLKKEKPLPPIEPGEVPFALPEGWVWTRLGACALSMTNGLYKPSKFYKDDGIISLRMYNIDNGLINFKNTKRLRATKSDIETYGLKENDLLVNRVNSLELVGKAAVVPRFNEPLVYESMNVRVRFLDTDVHFINILFQSDHVRSYFLRTAKKAIGQASINQTQIGNIVLGLPPLAEQHAIVERVDKLLGMVDQLEQQVAERKVQAEELMQAVLREAFG